MNGGALMYILFLLNQNKCSNHCELRDITVEELIIFLVLYTIMFFVLTYFFNKLF